MACVYQGCRRIRGVTFLAINKFDNIAENCRCFHYSPTVKREKLNNLKNKSVQSQAWLQRQFKDPYVAKAKYDNFRCRSAFKLLEINEQHKILLPGHSVIDCGAAPGSWTQVAVQCVKSNDLTLDEGSRGIVIAADILYFSSISGAIVLSEHDVTKSSTQEKIVSLLPDGKANVVLSDMCHSVSGIKNFDCHVVVQLIFHSLSLALKVLERKGHFLCKMLAGEETGRLVKIIEKHFEKCLTIKPEASRKNSSELYILGKFFKGNMKETVKDTVL